MTKRRAAVSCLLGAAALAVAGCATRGPLASLHSKTDQALVVGRIAVTYNQQVRTGSSELRFKQLVRNKTESTYFYGPGGAGPDIAETYRLDDSGLIVLELEPGQWVLEQIVCRLGERAGDMLYAFYREDTSFHVSQTGKIYYLGDGDVQWQGPNFKDWNLLRVLDPTNRPANDGELALSLKDDPEGMQTELSRRYGGNPVVERAWLGGGQGTQLPAALETGPQTPAPEPRLE